MHFGQIGRNRSQIQGDLSCKAATVVGVLFIVLGLAGLIAGGFTYTHQKKDVDMGPLQISHEQTRTVPIPPDPLAALRCLWASG